jgi:hypothetical protein
VFPYLAGQYPRYIEAQLNAFKQRARTGDPLGIMQGTPSSREAPCRPARRPQSRCRCHDSPASTRVISCGPIFA